MTAVAFALCPASAAAAEAPAVPAASGGENQLMSPIPGAPGERGLDIAGEARSGDEAAEDEEGELEPEQPTPEQLALAQTAPLASAATIAPSDEGHAKYRLDAATYFDEYAYDGEWIRAHVDVIKAYPPFGDVYVKYGKPVIGYHDPATEGFAPLNQPEIEAYVTESHLANLLEAIRESRAESADRDEQPVPRHLAEDEGRQSVRGARPRAGQHRYEGVRRRTERVDHHGAGLHRTLDLHRHPAWKRDPRGDGR